MVTNRVTSLRAGRAFLIVLVLSWCAPAQAVKLLMYRAASTGRWKEVAVAGDPLPAGSSFAGNTFKSFGNSSSLASTAACGGVSLVAFCARVQPSFQYAVFLGDAVGGAIHDVAPVSGCPRTNPAVVIDSSACTAHVIYLDGGTSDRTMRDATFSLPGITPVAVTTLFQNFITTAPPPFPSTAVLELRSSGANISAAYGTGPGVVVAFFALARGPGLTTTAGIFSWASGGTLTMHARTSDIDCAPPWPEAGTAYVNFRQAPIAAALVGPAVAFVARSNGASSKDTAIVLNDSGCGGTNVVQAAEHLPTPLGGQYGDLWNAELAGAANGTTVFTANVLGVARTPKALIRSSGDVVARRGFADTGLGSTIIGGPSTMRPSINSAGTVVFVSGLSGLPSGAVLFDTPTILPELVTFGANYPQIDELGNVVVMR